MKIKHLAVFLLITAFATPSFAANTLKYDVDTGEVLCMGAMPNLKPGEGEAVVTVDFAIPEDLSHYTFNGTTLVKKDKAVIEAAEKAVKDKKQSAYDKAKAVLKLTDEEMNILRLRAA